MRGRLLRQAIAISLIAWALTASLERLLAYVVNGPRWPTSSVTYFVNPANADVAPANALAAVQQAASAWSLQSLADIQLIYAGPTSGTTVQNNGVNEVFFSPESSGSTIAVCYYWWNGSNHIVDSDIKFYDGGFTFNTGTSGCSGGMFVEDVGTHEFGHFLGLGHSTVAAATMYPSISYCSQSARALDADDVAGVEAIYTPGSGSSPAAPYDLGVTPNVALPTSSLMLAWTDAASTETGFRVERSTNGTSFALVASPGANTTSFTDIGLAAGTTYFYRLSAYNGAGASGYSNTASAATAPVTTPPAVPTGPTPADGAVNVTGTTVSWAASNGAASYDVYFGTTANPAFRATTIGTSVSVGKLAAGVTHYWRVVAKNSAGSTTGATWRFTTKPKGRR